MASEPIPVGKLAEKVGVRDAVHVAIVSMIAPRRLFPGTRIDTDGEPDVASIGIVDPFLTLPVQQGEVFWCFLFPNTVTSLRHVWTHPRFEDQP